MTYARIQRGNALDDLRPGQEFVVRTASGSKYRVTAQTPLAGLHRVSVARIDTKPDDAFALDEAFLALRYGDRPLEVGRPLDLVAIDETGRRISLRTSPVATVDAVHATDEATRHVACEVSKGAVVAFAAG